MLAIIARLGKLGEKDRQFIESECKRALDALKEGVNEDDLEFEAFIEYVSLHDLVELAENGYPIRPQRNQEVTSWAIRISSSVTHR
jgi:hypothetical protein